MTPDNLYPFLLPIATIGCGIVAGLFFIFSIYIIGALSRLPSSQSKTAMQSINLVILNPVLFVVFFDTSASCLLVVITALSNDLNTG
ncbi:MAG: hypothetical protein VX910_07815 [Candidatus Latescibacterota bacterium]|nr:hypothetical protein [Candidatus Latescibacterota bacterium]